MHFSRLLTGIALAGALALPATAASAMTAPNPGPVAPWQGCSHNPGQKDGCRQCRDITTWITRTVWVRDGWYWFRTTERVPVTVRICSQNHGYQGNGGPVGDPTTPPVSPPTSPPATGGPGGNHDHGTTCTPVTFTVSSTGTSTVTEAAGGPVLKNGEEVSYAGPPVTDYTVTDVAVTAGVTTFELEGPLPAITLHTEGGSAEQSATWQLTTVCPAPVS